MKPPPAQCAPRKNDPLLLGYFIGNEPPWGDRESEVVDMILAGSGTATQSEDSKSSSPQETRRSRRKEFVIAAFEKQLELVGAAIRKYDPNHLNLGIRFGGNAAGGRFAHAGGSSTCAASMSTNTSRPNRSSARTASRGRPVLIGEFHFGVPENGLGAGLVQTRDQTERGKGYRYYVEQAAALPGFSARTGSPGAMNRSSAAWTARTTTSALWM